MKKVFSIILVIVMLLSFAACGSTGKNTAVNPAPAPANNDPAPAPESGGDAEPSDVGLSEPELVWWQVKTETGIPTLVAELKNNNSVAIDINFDIDFCQNSQLLSTRTDDYAIAVGAGESTMIFDTWEIPAEADAIEIRYTYLEESMYAVVPSSVQAEKKSDNSLVITGKVDGDFEEFDVGIAFFSGDHCVAMDYWSFFSGEELSYTSEPLEAYDSYRLYNRAYIYR